MTLAVRTSGTPDMARRPMLCPADDPILKQLTDRCNERGITAAQLDLLSGVSSHTFREWREGRADPTLSRLRMVAAMLDYDIVLKKRRRK